MMLIDSHTMAYVTLAHHRDVLSTMEAILGSHRQSHICINF